MDSFKDWLIEEYYKSYSDINKPDFVKAAAFKKVIKKYNEYGTEEINPC